MIPYHRLIYLGLFSVIMAGFFCDTAQAQWRGRYVRRDGLFHVERYHWGGGITPAGASVLTTGITQFAPIVGGFFGREAPPDDQAKERDASHLSSNDEYIEELRKARQLLAETAQLVDWKPSDTTHQQPTPAIQPTPGDDKPVTATEKEFGPNPWKKVQ